MKSCYRNALILLAGLAAAGCKDSTNLSIVGSVVVTPPTPSVVVGSSVALSATPMSTDGIPVPGVSIAWSSSDTTIATVNAVGLVTTKAVGAATISASTGNVSGSAVLTVLAAAPVSPTFGHVFIVGLLQTDYTAVFPGTASPMPYLDSLAQANGIARQYYGNVQPSIGNFYMLATGDTVTNDDNNTTIFTGDNIVRQLISAGKTWKSYAEDIPSVGYLGPDQGLYSRHHNVFVLLSDVANSVIERQHVVPLTQLATDIAASQLPNFGMIVPNECHNSHQCTLPQVDAFLRTTLAPLIASPQFQADGLLIILWDRSSTSSFHGGGRAAWVVVSPKAIAGHKSDTMFQHQSTLRLALNALGVGIAGVGQASAVPGQASAAPDMMGEFFTP